MTNQATEQLREQVQGILAEPTGTNDHTLQRRIRWLKVAQLAVETGPGDFAEIGAMEGDTTVPLCEIAEKYDRRVLVVDPWTTGTQNCQGHEYETFVRRTQKWQVSGVLHVIRKPSQSELAIIRLLGSPWAFALVDGLHQYRSVVQDAMSVRYARVICFDDMNMPDVTKAYEKVLTLLPERVGLQDPTLAKKWEGYLI